MEPAALAERDTEGALDTDRRPCPAIDGLQPQRRQKCRTSPLGDSPGRSDRKGRAPRTG